jgi:hypothetical protein
MAEEQSVAEAMEDMAAMNTQSHLDSVADTGTAYTEFKGWVLTCQWCVGFPTQTFGKTKEEALGRMQDHYDRVCGKGRVVVHG